MTIYTDLDSLCAGLSDADLNDTKQVTAFQGLIKTYFNALHNPPRGVIGVGAITHAEKMLIASQTGEL